MTPRLASVLLSMLALLVPGTILGHSQGETWSVISISGSEIEMTYTMRAADLAERLPAIAHSADFDGRWTHIVSTGVSATAAGQPCHASGRDLRQTSDLVSVRWRLACATSDSITIHNDALFPELPNHLHIAKALIDGQATKEKLFTRSDRTWTVTGPGDALGSFTAYLKLGIIHIAGGYDHLAFLLAVILLSPGPMALLLMVTGFTIGHSVTLGMAVLGYANVNGSAIEALIGLTIALVAAEVMAVRYQFHRSLVVITATGLLAMAWTSHSSTPGDTGPNALTLVGITAFAVCYLSLSGYGRLRNRINPVLTMVFGMIHGFGFAGLLLETGLPVQQVIPSLVGFNLGVEVGQLLILAGILVPVQLLARHIRPPWFFKDGLASLLCGLGLFLFVARSF